MKELFADPVIPPNCDGLPRDNILTVLAISPLSRCRPWYRLYRKDLAICYMFYRSTVFASEHWKITSGTEPNSLLAKFRVPVRTRCRDITELARPRCSVLRGWVCGWLEVVHRVR
jgi:hypothetical protein